MTTIQIVAVVAVVILALAYGIVRFNRYSKERCDRLVAEWEADEKRRKAHEGNINMDWRG